MLLSVLVMLSAVSSSRTREKVLPALGMTSFSICSCGRIVSPVTLISEIVYFSPSVTLAVRYMSRFSGLIDTWVESMLKSM